MALIAIGCETPAGEDPPPALDVVSPGACEAGECPASCEAKGLHYFSGEGGKCAVCTTDEHCGNGVCHPQQLTCVSCYDDVDCPLGVCNRAGGYFCVKCLQNEDCKSGECNLESSTCVGCGSHVECDDENPCTIGSCTEQRACVFAPVDDGVLCDAGPCTTDGKCVGGVCQSGGEDPLCGACQSSEDCGEAELCLKEPGACDEPGTCFPRPEKASCNAKMQEVCGCNQKSYGNACLAQADGTSVGQQGSCCVPPVCVGAQLPADPDEDGCADVCECPEVPVCSAPFAAEDTTQDGCKDACVCQPVACPPLTSPVDTDEDGCADDCACDKVCPPDLSGRDTDSDGCPDYCCKPLGCAGDQKPVHTGGPDICEDECLCKPAECPTGTYGIDTDGNTCTDTCCSKIACPVGHQAKDLSQDGCPDACCAVCPTDGQWVGIDDEQDGCIDQCACKLTCQPLQKMVDADKNGCPEACCDPFDCEGAKLAFDSDADGCDDVCVCPTAPLCMPPHGLQDLDGDGCKETCDCVDIECPSPATPTDVNLDGCPDQCCSPVPCDPPNLLVDTDADGCKDVCKCVGLFCPSGYTPADMTGDGCPEDCVPCPLMVCDQGQKGLDTTGDGCLDTCVPCPLLNCEVGSGGADLDGDGCPDTCYQVACAKNSECPAGSWCAVPEGECGGKGGCKAPPADSVCEVAGWEPVCGCDGQTWPSACTANSQGIAIAYAGACEQPCKADSECQVVSATIKGTVYCHTAVGACGKEGSCMAAKLEKECESTTNEPVCGCDGETYFSECVAYSKGVSLLSKGACECPAIPCLSWESAVDTDGDECPDTCAAQKCKAPSECTTDAVGQKLFCSRAVGACGEVGVCLPPPDDCTSGVQTVCGCDGETYASACEAALDAGISVKHAGTCACPAFDPCADGHVATDEDGDGCPDVCKAMQCKANSDCGDAANTICKKSTGLCDATVTGLCENRPTVCDAGGEEACGCDGKIYPNECEADKAGVGIIAFGKCGG